MSDSPSLSDSAPASRWMLLRRGPFARYMAGETISMLGTWMQMMAQAWVVAGLTSSTFTLGLMNFASCIPMLILASWGGIMADRHDKRRILLATQVVQIVLAIIVGWLVGRGTITVWYLVIAGFLLGINTAFEMPAASALIPELVSRPQLRAAISVDRSIFHATRLAGPALAGLAVHYLGTSSAFYANAASFVAMIVALLTLPPRPPGNAEEEAQRQTGMREGWLYVRSDIPTRSMLLLLTSVTTCVSPFFMVMMSNYCRYVLHIEAEQFGLLMGSSGLGAFLGSLWLLRIPTAHRTAYLSGAIVTIVVCMTGLAAARNIVQAVSCMVLLTIGTSTIFGLANTIVQERAPDALRGRVSAIAGMSFFGVLPFSGLLTSKIADIAGLRRTMAGSALFFGAMAALLLYRHFRAQTQAARAEEPVATVAT